MSAVHACCAKSRLSAKRRDPRRLGKSRVFLWWHKRPLAASGAPPYDATGSNHLN